MRDLNSERVAHSSFIGPPLEGKSLLQFLVDRFTYFNPQQWTHFITIGDVLLNGESCDPETLIKRGDEVRYLAMNRPEPKVPTQIPVLFEDSDLLIVNKPPHLPVHPGGRYLRNSLIHLLQRQRGHEFLVLSHRLDRETSGVCVLSKTPLAKDKMYWQFFKGEVEKTYWALTWGIPRPLAGTIDAPIGQAMGQGSKVSSKIRIKQAVGGGESKVARTKYHTLGTRWIEAPQWTPPPWPALVEAIEKREGEFAPDFKGPWPISLVECRPMTGRTNQIRVHLAHIGSGIVGDKLYDPSEETFLEVKNTPPVMAGDKGRAFLNLSDKLHKRLVLDAHALHAKNLKFRHPRTGKIMGVEAPLPSSWHGLYTKPHIK
jgi:23S rRNA-/tRNA-specific pseudouridylate synthase